MHEPVPRIEEHPRILHHHRLAPAQEHLPLDRKVPLCGVRTNRNCSDLPIEKYRVAMGVAGQKGWVHRAGTRGGMFCPLLDYIAAV